MNRIHIYTGDGKGKTTAAVGLLIRFLGSGGKACLIQFDKGAKEGDDFYGERKILATLPGLTLRPTGLPRFDRKTETFRFNNIPGDFEEAAKGLELAKQSFTQGYGLVVLDEVLSLVLTKLASRADIESLVDSYEQSGRPCELVMTGHTLWPSLESRVDLITQMRKMKHYFDADEKARKGIEY